MKEDNSPLHEKYKPAIQSDSQIEKVLDVSTLPEKCEDTSLEKSILDDEWDNLTQDWQSQPVEKTDIYDLVKQTRNRMLWAKSIYVLNIIATLSLLVSFGYGVFKDEFGTPWNTYFGVGGLLSCIFVYYETKIRLAVWSKINASPDEAIENALVGYQSALKYMIFTKWSFLPFGALANWFCFTMSADEKLIFNLLFVNIITIITVIITYWFQKKREKEYHALLDKVKSK